jgi:hypothetical protein
MVFPEPTSPYMYIPFGRFASIGGSEKEAGLDGERREEKKDFLAGWRDSIVGWRTVGCVHVASITCKSSRFLMMSASYQHVSFCHLCVVSHFSGARRPSTAPNPLAHHTHSSVHESSPSRVSRLHQISKSFLTSNTSNIHSFATCAYPLTAAGTARATPASGTRALAAWPRALLILILQSKHIVLLDSATTLAGTRLGAAWRERVRNPRRASDDVISNARARRGSEIA